MLSVLPVYRRSDIEIIRGEGVYLYAPGGRAYLDFAAGIAVNSLGHCHPHVVKALKDQAEMLWHCSNLYRMPGLEKLAERFCQNSFADKVFFCNSGTEAVECGLKMIRKYHDANGQPERFRVVTFEGGFHGRTFACISAGGNDIARKGYEPLLDGFDRVPLNDIKAVKNTIGPETAGILIEPIQGEGGIREASQEFMQALRALCDEHGLLLFIDEVQCGMGRTGHLFAHEELGVKPDIVSVAKGIGNGFPLAACLTTNKVADVMTPGSHGSTYGSNPLAMAVGNAVLDVILQDGFLGRVAEAGTYLKAQLQQLMWDKPHLIREVRGRGLMLGIQLQREVKATGIVAELRTQGLLTTSAEDNVIRITPPLVVEQKHIDEAIHIMNVTAKAYEPA